MATVLEEEVETEEESGVLELTDREKAIAEGRDPDEVGADAEDGDEEEAEDTDVDDTEVDASNEEGKEAPGSDWATDSIKELAQSYGIDDASLALFESEDDFRRFASIYEKAGGQVAQPDEEEPPDAQEESKDEDALDPAAFETDGYDENTVKIVKGVVQAQSTVNALLTRIEQLEQRLASGDQQRELDAFNLAVDELGGRFGSSGSLTDEQRNAREKLLVAVPLVKKNFENRGEKAVSTPVLLRRAELLAFGDEIIQETLAKEKEALTQKVKKQSAKRRSVGRNTKPPVRRELPGEADDPVKAIANAPELLEYWRENVQD